METDFGLSGTAGAWLRSYLKDRQQYVKVGEAVGEQTVNAAGVPQGSVLGPILFAAYMSPLDRIIGRHGVKQHHYADDTTLFVELRGPSDYPSERLKRCIDDVVIWCLFNDMKINPDKTETMLVSSLTQLKQYDQTRALHVADSTVTLSGSVKILGVTIDSNLTYDKHVELVCQSCNYHIRALRHIRHMLPLHVANQVACSIVSSRLDYCNSLLANTSAHNTGKLQRIQNNLARIVFNSPARASASPLLQKLHWLPINHRIRYKIANLTYTTLSSSTPGYLYDALKHYTPTRSLRSADAHLLETPSTVRSLAIAEKAFSHAAPCIWNSLSFTTRSSPSLSIFKSRLKTELFIDAFLVCLP